MHLQGPTIECEDARNAIVDAFDGGGLPRSIKRHARHCADCKALNKGLKSDRRALKALAPPGPLVIYLQMLLGKGHGPRSGPPGGGHFIPALGTGLASFAVVAGLVVGSDALKGNSSSPLSQPKQQVVEVSQASIPEAKPQSVGNSAGRKSAPRNAETELGATSQVVQDSNAPSTSKVVSKSGSPSSAPVSTNNQSSSRGESNSKQESSSETKQTSSTKSIKREKPRETEIGTGGSSPTAGSTPASSGTGDSSSSSSTPTEVGSTNGGSGDSTDTSGSSNSTADTQAPSKNSQKPVKKQPGIKRSVPGATGE